MSTISVCTEPGQQIIENLASDPRFNVYRNFSQLSTLLFPWPDAWNELKKVALYKSDVLVSQVPISGVGSLLSMNALRPFSAAEISFLGGAGAFHCLAWDAIKALGDGQIYAMPWLLNPFGIFYWRDMLEKAGVDESSAFSSFENMQDTFARLRASGVEYPWAHATNSPRSAMMAACMWIWAAGGEIVSPDGRSVLFNQPAALRGLKAYFELVSFIKINSKPTQNFNNRQAVAMIGEYSVSKIVRPENLPNLGVTTLPGPTFVGGSCLVAWNHTLRNQASQEIINFLLQKDILLEYCTYANDFPARLDVISMPSFSTDPYLKAFSGMLERGRTFPITRASGILQTKMIILIEQIWQALLAQPSESLDTLFDRILQPEVARLNRLLVEY